ncbi:hypothetical protein [Actinokineospora iranica]|uniref:Uncharacterized protein n=1 Tax=Actinokineospora iranica TaxID=1271860 RepID=A0A1G6R1P3_9PSEU|nr:hypothetical protein [Actinokineospora iranica]SDC97955.1 hypothetical protein SAMN05216174_10667 [Actinokineospora iranica]
MTAKTPDYFLHFGRTFKLDTAPDGQWIGYLLNWSTGEFEIDNDPIMAVLSATSTSDISRLDKDEFVQETEGIRAYHLRGDGPIFALYDTIHTLFAQAEAENRKITDEELALIKSIRRRTFAMWEAEAARRAAGEQPSLSVTRR